jgi:hypothetical protein
MTATATSTTSTNELQLPRRALHRVADLGGRTITCNEGTLWITLDNDPRDIVLEAGESYAGGEHVPALIYAMAAARLRIEETSPALYSRNDTMLMLSRFQAMPLMKAAR